MAGLAKAAAAAAAAAHYGIARLGLRSQAASAREPPPPSAAIDESGGMESRCFPPLAAAARARRARGKAAK